MWELLWIFCAWHSWLYVLVSNFLVLPHWIMLDYFVCCSTYSSPVGVIPLHFSLASNSYWITLLHSWPYYVVLYLFQLINPNDQDFSGFHCLFSRLVLFTSFLLVIPYLRKSRRIPLTYLSHLLMTHVLFLLPVYLNCSYSC